MCMIHFSLHEKSFVTGTSVHEPNSRMASFTTLRAKLLLGDSDPLSFVTIALSTENPSQELHCHVKVTVLP